MKVNIQNISNSKVLLINGELIDVLSAKKSKVDILIENGKIIEIGKIGKFENAEIIDCKDKIITQSFIDINSSFKTPGINDDEDLSSGSNAAMAGGYSKVCLMPDTNPIIDDPELVKFINNESKGLPITIYPIGAITKELKGQDLAELGLMHNAGAVALSNGKKTIMNGQVARYAMEYTKMFNIPFINHPECLNLVNNGYMNESGLRKGGKDCIASNHNPIKIDDKDNDFYHSKSGIIGLETAFSSSHTKLIKNGFKIETILNFFSLNPSKIMNLDLCDFKLGSNAELVIIDPNKKWIFSEDDIYSKSSNTPFIGQEFIGKICGTISKSNLFIK